MNATAILETLNDLGIEVTASGDKIVLQPGSEVPADLVGEIRQHKAEIMAHLGETRLAQGTPLWHAQEIAKVVKREGVCLFWSDLFGEMVAFIADESFRDKVLPGVVAYTDHELRELLGAGKRCSRDRLRLVHEAKKQGARVTEST